MKIIDQNINHNFYKKKERSFEISKKNNLNFRGRELNKRNLKFYKRDFFEKKVGNHSKGNFFTKIQSRTVSLAPNQHRNSLFKVVNLKIRRLGRTFLLEILKIKNTYARNNQENCNKLTKGTLVEAKCSNLGLVTKSGTLVTRILGKITNNPFLDGCVNAISLD